MRSLASALCIGTGGSVGREGPIVQIGSALGSSIGQWLRVPEHRLRLMLACGAAGGISATFDAPVAAVGGVLLGAVLLALPQMYGVGYPVLESAVSGSYTLGLLLLLLVGKMVATSLTIGIGGSGGVFAPSLFVGGMLGTAFGFVAQAAFPGLALSPGAFGLVGMAAVVAAASHAPIAAALIVFELTGQYAVILPLLVAVALATGLSHLISRDTIYTRKLLRRGIDIDESMVAREGRG